MNKTASSLTLALLLSATSAQADVVVAEEQDNLVGKTTGAWLGVLVGGAAGGPAGAAIGGVIGLFSGSTVQSSAGLSGTAYRVKLASGEEKLVRSPNQGWSNGDQVQIQGNRLIAASGTSAQQ